MQPARLDLSIIQGATLRQVLRIMQPVLEYRPITAIASSAPVQLTVDHGLPTDWPVWVRGVVRMPALNAEPIRQRPHMATVVDAATLEINPLSATGLAPAGGELVYNLPVDLTGATAVLQVLDDAGGELLSITPTVNAGGWIEVELSDEETAALTWRTGSWLLDISFSNGDVFRAFTGTAKVWPAGTSPVAAGMCAGGWVVTAGAQGVPGAGFEEAPVDGETYGRKDAVWVPLASTVAGVASFNGRGGAVLLTGTDVTTALGYTPANNASLAAVAFSGSYIDLADKPFIPTAPGDIGAASIAQGALADTAVQPAALSVLLDLKVDKIAGYGLSQENFTTAEKAKLAGLDGPLWKGTYTSLAALQSAHPTAEAGSSAHVDAGVGDPVKVYNWDASDGEWVAGGGDAAPVTAAQVKILYESNPDTNAFTNAEKSKLGGVAAGATANANTDSLPESATPTNKWFTTARVLATVLSGLSLATGSAVVDTDSVLAGFGKLQRQINDLTTALGGKQATLVSGDTIKTINGESLLGPGDLTVGGGGTVGLIQVYDEAPVDPPEYQLFMVVTPPDTEPPEVTSFTATSGVASPVPITSFTATDNVGVTGYWVGTSSAEPALGDPGWSATPQTSFATASTGSVTLYARARDAAGNISAAVSQVVVIKDAYYDISWPYNSAIHTTVFSVSAGSFTTDSAIPVTPPTAMTIKSVMIPMRRQAEASYPGTGTVQLQVRSGSATGTVLATATAVVSPSGTVEVKTFTLPSNLSLAAGTTYFFTLSLVSPTGGDALYRILCDKITGSMWSRYNAGAWTSYVSQSPIRLEKV